MFSANGYMVEILWPCRETSWQAEKANGRLLHRKKPICSTQTFLMIKEEDMNKEVLT
jgi:hypothetical protein